MSHPFSLPSDSFLAFYLRGRRSESIFFSKRKQDDYNYAASNAGLKVLRFE